MQKIKLKKQLIVLIILNTIMTMTITKWILKRVLLILVIYTIHIDYLIISLYNVDFINIKHYKVIIISLKNLVII